MPDPLAAAFTEALAKPAGPIPAVYAEDYAAELAALARRVLGAETQHAIQKVHDHWASIPDAVENRRAGAMRACDIITATLGLWPVKVGDVRHAQGMKGEVVELTPDGYVAFMVDDDCRYTLTLSTFMQNWSDRA